MDGLVLVRKPLTWTSHDVVRSLRRTLGERRIGHFGTLDPLASGLLLAAVGRATRLFPYFVPYPKTYQARIRLGFATNTYDAEGTPLAAERTDLPPVSAVAEALGRFEGEIEQVPPPYSAKKLRGKPLYVYARKNEEVERRPSRIHIESFRLKAYDPPCFEAEVICSSGTYVRSLAHDLGLRLGCGAHLSGLIRTAIGPYRIEDAHDPEDIRAFRDADGTDRFLIPLERLLLERPACVLSEREAADVRHGRTIRPEAGIIPGAAVVFPTGPSIVRLLGPDGALVSLAKPGAETGTLAPVVVFF